VPPGKTRKERRKQDSKMERKQGVEQVQESF